MADNSVLTEKKFIKIYDEKIYPYLNGATHTGCVPLGTILPYFGETAPTHFLICDGTEYAKADYPELAEHLLALTDPTPYEGSDANHFKVPDLRGEFLRGSGTNSHTKQGKGANVGVHQNATTIPLIAVDTQNNTIWTNGEASNPNEPTNRDSQIIDSTKKDTFYVPKSGNFQGNGIQSFTTRPTNTSVTYIIAYRNAYIDLALDSFPIDISNPTDGQLLMYDATAGRWVNGGHKYSTDEHVVGTWIDGKPIYEKTFLKNTGITTGLNTLTHNISNLDKIIKIEGMGKREDGYFMPIPTGSIKTVDIPWSVMLNGGNSIAIQFSIGENYVSPYAFTEIYIIIHYTKTTDTV